MAAEDKAVRLTTMRKIIAERMTQSLQETAQYTLTREIDADVLEAFIREQKDKGRPLRMMHVMVMVCAVLLDKTPLLNARIIDNKLVYFGTKNIGVAVAVKDGLMVPVIRDVLSKNIDEIIEEYGVLVKEARSTRIDLKKLAGGTFTISNLGMVGVDGFTPIINYPEAAILGIGRIRPVPDFREDGSIGMKHAAVFSLTLDHKLVDGYTGAMFLQDLSDTLNDLEALRRIIDSGPAIPECSQ